MYIRVRVTPGAKKEKVDKIKSDFYKVSLKEPAQRNLANKRLIEVIAREFGKKETDVRILNGHLSRSKILDIKEKCYE